MAYADILTDVQRRTARINAVGSTWFGCVAEVLVDSSAFITLYILALGGSAAMAVLVAGFTGLVNMFALIPSATIVTRMGLKRAVKYADDRGGYLPFRKNAIFPVPKVRNGDEGNDRKPL